MLALLSRRGQGRGDRAARKDAESVRSTVSLRQKRCSPASQTRRSFVMWQRSDASMCSSPSAAAPAAAATSTGRKGNTQIKETIKSQSESLLILLN